MRGGVADFETMARVLRLDINREQATGQLEIPQFTVEMEPIRGYITEQYFKGVLLEHRLVGGVPISMLVVPVANDGTEQAFVSNDHADVVRIEITQGSRGGYRIAQDGVLLLAYQLGKLGMDREAIVKSIRRIFDEYEITQVETQK